MNDKSIMKKAILVVSFGTSYNDTREKTIDVIERQIGEQYPDWQVYRAWTSKMIIRKRKMRDQVHIFTVTEAMEQMLADGVEELVVQPTHIINGIENDRMKEDVCKYQDRFRSVRFGEPLLSSDEDNVAAIKALMTTYADLADDEVLVFMGHGTDHYVNTVYAALDYTCKDLGYSNVYMGTVEAYPSIETLLKKVGEHRPSQVILAPFMLVAGDHARNDMSGEDENSWKCQFERAGFRVRCVLKGLGEDQRIRDIFYAHLAKAMGEGQGSR